MLLTLLLVKNNDLCLATASGGGVWLCNPLKGPSLGLPAGGGFCSWSCPLWDPVDVVVGTCESCGFSTEEPQDWSAESQGPSHPCWPREDTGRGGW